MSRPRRHSFLLLYLWLAACSGDDTGDNPFGEVEEEPEEIVERPLPMPGEDSDDDGWIDDIEERIGTDYLTPDIPCASERYSITEQLTIPSADFVFIVDSSGSMLQELPLIKSGLQSFFGPLLGNSQLDFRVIFIASFRDTGGFCISNVAGGFECNIERPSKTDTFLFYDQDVASKNALSLLLSTFERADSARLAPDGWKSFLRPDAELVITAITDDDSDLEFQDFVDRFKQLDTANTYHDGVEPLYTFHSIIGITDSPTQQVWQPTSSLQRSSCFSAPNAGIEYQHMSILTGGLRFPICRSLNYGAMLEQSTRAIFESGYIPCTFPIPASRDASLKAGSEQLSLQLERPGEPAKLLERVATSAQCAQGDFFIQRTGFGSNSVSLCTDLCEEIQSSINVTLRVATDCTEISCTDISSPTHAGMCF